MASTLGSAAVASSVGSKSVFDSMRAKICNEWREGNWSWRHCQRGQAL
jgi:hypothetical protein